MPPEREAPGATELADARRLRHTHAALASRADLRRALEEIIATSNQYLGTDRGCIQLLSEDGERLEMFAWQGYQEQDRFVQHFLHEGTKAACDAARRDRKRLVIEDIETFPALAGTVDREVALREGIRATQHTPLFSRNGELSGVLSNQFREPHRPTEDQLKSIDLLAWSAADLIELHQAARRFRASEERQGFLLQLSDTLRSLADPVDIEGQACRVLGEWLAADRTYYCEVDAVRHLLVVERDFVRGDAPSLTGTHPIKAFDSIIDEMRAGRSPVIEDVEATPLIGEADRAAYLQLSIRSFMCVPLIKGGALVAAMCVANVQPRQWTSRDVALLRDVGERIRDAAVRARAEIALETSEEKYHALFAVSSAPFLLLAPDSPRFTIIDVNQAYLEATMTTREGLLGRPVFEMFPDNPGDPDIAGVRELRAAFERALASKRPTALPRLKFDIARPDGRFEERWWDPVNTPVLDTAGNITALIHHATDVTAVIRAEAALHAREERQTFLLKLSDALRAQPDPINIGAVATRMLAGHMGVDRSYVCECSRDRNLAWIGPEYHDPRVSPVAGKYRLSDFPESLGRLETGPVAIADLRNDASFPERERRAIGAMGMNAVLTGIQRKGERDYAWALAVGNSEARDWTPEDRSLVEAAAERTWTAMEHARVEEALRENQERLQQASRAKDEFIAMLGHELRNPLAPIATTLQLMKLRAPDVFVREREIMDAQVRYLTGLVDDLLDVARIARGKVELEQEPLAIADIVAAAVETTQPTMEEHRQSLHTQVEDGLMVTGDRRRLVQVLVNLLGNAAKYSPPDRAIELRAAAEHGQVAVRVRDQGRGIAPELLSRVFEAFIQDAQAIDRAGGGLGLGLSIVRNLVAMHGGSVEALSDGRDKGSEFIVRLPLLETEPASGEAGVVAAGDSVRSPEAEAGAKRIKVLIVDDFAVAAESLALLLQEMGYSTHVAYDGAAALQAFADFRPDIALIDIGLPVMDGYEVARSVRSTPGREHLPLIAITGYGQINDHVRVMEAGFDEHLVKPLRAGKIGPLIEKLVTA